MQCQVKSLQDCLPEADDIRKLRAFRGDKTTLGDAEKFVIEMIEVSNCSELYQCLLFKTATPSRLDEQKKAIACFTKACLQVKGSTKLRKLLGWVLKVREEPRTSLKLSSIITVSSTPQVGNKLNGDGDGNEIKAFTLDSLLKLSHTKAFNKDTTVRNLALPPYSSFTSVPICIGFTLSRKDGQQAREGRCWFSRGVNGHFCCLQVRSVWAAKHLASIFLILFRPECQWTR